MSFFDEILSSPELPLLMSGLGSAMSGDPRHLNGALGMHLAFQELAMQREALKQRERKKQALGRMPALLQDLQAYPAFVPRQGAKSEALGLLAEVAPDEIVGGLLSETLPTRSEERAEPADLRMMERLGIPLTIENYAKFKSVGGAQGVSLLDQAQLAKILLDIKGMTGDRAAADEDKRRKRLTAQTTIGRNLTDIEDALELVDQVEGTFLETGIPFGDARRGILSGSRAVMNAFGLDKPEMGDTLDAYDKLNKTLNRLVISRDTGALGTLTDSKLALVQDAMGSTKVSPTALRSVLLDAANGMLDEAAIQEYEIGDRAGFEERFGARRKQKRKAPGKPLVDVPKLADDAAELVDDAADAAGAAVLRAADIARMGAADLAALDVDALSDELADAVLERLDELQRK